MNFLLEAGAGVNAPPSALEHQIRFRAAAEGGHRGTVDVLLKPGAHANAVSITLGSSVVVCGGYSAYSAASFSGAGPSGNRGFLLESPRPLNEVPSCSPGLKGDTEQLIIYMWRSNKTSFRVNGYRAVVN